MKQHIRITNIDLNKAIFLGEENISINFSNQDGRFVNKKIVQIGDEINLDFAFKSLKIKGDYLANGIFTLTCKNPNLPATFTIISELVECNDKGFVESLYYGNAEKGWIRCNSGAFINVLKPNPNHIFIEDIAHALSRIPRFGGHLENYFSVASHIILGIELVEDEYKFDWLMHDCSEAYLLDIPSPLKKNLPDYIELENYFMMSLSNKFGFNYPLPIHIKEIDNKQLDYEWTNLFIGKLNLGYDCNWCKSEFLRLYNLYKRK